ncbi:MAG TPA: NADPH-dependent FMN reductase [Methyloceanibacter sp.]|jgi:NAD(P)H-dependent FMN reductase|nr:NADPH-dependent FMN reductase [Methyloceanibacter sp.]
METPMRLLFFAGSAQEGSHNKKLARLGQKIAEANGIEAIFADLADYEMPIYHGDLEKAEGVPERARAFKALLGEYDGVMIVTPEYNAGIPGLLKNTLDWVSRVRTEPNVYRTRVFAISGTSPGYYGAMRSLLQLREVLAVGLGATVIPQQMALPGAMKAFAEDGSLVDDTRQKMFADVVEALAVAARKFAA